MQSQTQPKTCGFLFRESDGPIRQYQRRWFEISGGRLLYFTNQNAKDKKQLPTGSIPLSGAEIDGESKISNLIIQITNKDKVFKLQAETVSDFERWVRELTAVTTQEEKKIVSRKRTIVMLEKKAITNLMVTLNDFEVLQTLGHGQFGKVMKIRKKDNGKIFAMKVIDKKIVLLDEFVEHTNNEQVILKTIDHPFIVHLHYAFQTKDKLCLILDFLSGGELFYHLQKEKRFSIEKVRFYVGEIFLAIEHLHSKNIIYRDLKCENIVLDEQGHAVVTDFGLSKTNVSDNNAFTMCGTAEYLAPEILKCRGHGKAVDYWSLGIMMFTLLCGYPPFSCPNVMFLYQLIMGAGEVKFPQDIQSDDEYQDAKSLIMGLLQREPHDRLDATGVRSHPFFEGLDWDQLARREIAPPFVPDQSSAYVDQIVASEDSIEDIFQEKVINEDENFKDYSYDIDWS